MSAVSCARRRSKRPESNEIDAEAFKAIEDREVAGVIAKQEAAGLQSVSDGEYRRVSWNIDFLEQLDGVESYAASARSSFKRAARSRARCSFA